MFKDDNTITVASFKKSDKTILMIIDYHNVRPPRTHTEERTSKISHVSHKLFVLSVSAIDRKKWKLVFSLLFLFRLLFNESLDKIIFKRG